MSEKTSAISPRHRVGLVQVVSRTAFALACAVVLSAVVAGCSGVLPGAQTSNHACADKVAQSPVTGSVPGLWNCLDSKLQSTLTSIGFTGDGAIVTKPFALVTHYMGSTADASTYQLTLTISAAQQVGSKFLIFTVWTDPDGKVSDIGFSQPVY